MGETIEIDGAMGEGGGQVLRTSLSLAAVTGRRLEISNIRAGRQTKGLLRQHLAAARAVAEITGGALDGATLGSTSLRLTPGPVRPDRYRFAVGSAGSALLVLQTVLPPLVLASAASTVELEGGTHNPSAPPYDFIERVFLPQLARLGPRVETEIFAYGFLPAGGGRLVARIEPAARLEPFELHHRGEKSGEKMGRRATALLANLPEHIGERLVARFQKRSGWPARQLGWREVPSPGPGVAFIAEAHYEHVTEMVTGFGRVGLPAEELADRVFRAMRRRLRRAAPVGEHLADQLILPLALAGGGGFTTGPLSLHARTQVELVPRFLDLTVTSREVTDGVRVEIS